MTLAFILNTLEIYPGDGRCPAGIHAIFQCLPIRSVITQPRCEQDLVFRHMHSMVDPKQRDVGVTIAKGTEVWERARGL
ncbi:hypothetical protein AOQ71_20165 [Bradyrhizobium manausense]|uniref:Uncharacterized protein n=1 Tax=Bradyrhizobium manausense TaxID=989370 RepID=A0A0R3DQC8_9BRAD|nr:hypothetical protein AOQ71_20165 [Bradyrhizobium manausense]